MTRVKGNLRVALLGGGRSGNAAAAPGRSALKSEAQEEDAMANQSGINPVLAFVLGAVVVALIVAGYV